MVTPQIFLCYNSSYSQSVLLESFGPSFNSPVEIKNASTLLKPVGHPFYLE